MAFVECYKFRVLNMKRGRLTAAASAHGWWFRPSTRAPQQRQEGEKTLFSCRAENITQINKIHGPYESTYNALPQKIRHNKAAMISHTFVTTTHVSHSWPSTLVWINLGLHIDMLLVWNRSSPYELHGHSGKPVVISAQHCKHTLWLCPATIVMIGPV